MPNRKVPKVAVLKQTAMIEAVVPIGCVMSIN